MLPNWLYGKSKSKLASILGGGGGTPSDYDEVKAQVTQNAEDIELLSDALDTKAALTQITNPNLLDNPWFTVNQREFTSTSSQQYTVDRWKIVDNTDNLGSVAVNADESITLDNTNGTAHLNFRQILTTAQSNTDIYKSLLGKDVTLSLLYTDGTVESASGKVPTNPDSWTPICNLGNSAKLKGVVSLQMNSGETFVTIGTWAGYVIQNIKAVKLELGSVSTLAMDTAPNYATELAKCQRYYQKFTSGPSESLILGLGVANTATTGICTISLPSAMRATPTLILPNTFSVVVYASGTTITGSSLVINNLENNILQLNAAWSENITAGQVIGIQLLNTAYIALDAEL